jgi:hypothetical protein
VITPRILCFAMLLPGLVQAEETIHWDDLTKIINDGKHDESREYTIVTESGLKLKTKELSISQAALQVLQPYQLIPHDQVKEVQVRHRGRLSYFAWILNKYCDGRGDEYGCLFDPTVLILLPIDLAYGAAATPLMLPIEGVRRLLPAKIYKIAP